MKTKAANLIIAMFTSLVFPKPELIAIMGICLVLDFITGIVKCKVNGVARTSSGFRRSITKVLQYFGAIIVSIILTMLSRYDESSNLVSQILNWFTNALVVFIIYIELTSCVENMYACDPTSILSKKVFKPLLNFLTFQMKNNPATTLDKE